jgi:hypothetical protein
MRYCDSTMSRMPGSPLSTLHLKIREGCEEPYVEFHVDGQDLGRRVAEAFGEASFDDDVLPWRGYIEKTVLGQKTRKEGAEHAILFVCGCGEPTCRAVFADVIVAGDTITLQNFSTWHVRQTVVAPIEPIVFDRKQYNDAIQQLERDIANWHPPQKSGLEK